MGARIMAAFLGAGAADQCRNPVFVSLTPDGLRLRLDTHLAIEDRTAALHPELQGDVNTINIHEQLKNTYNEQRTKRKESSHSGNERI